jgi:hypothetical protein
MTKTFVLACALVAVLGIRMFLGLPDSDPDPAPDPSLP